MRRVRVLIVDDSVTVQRIVTDVVAREPKLELVGVAANGRLALTKISQLHPDVVTLHLEMPEVGELEILRVLRRTHPRLPIIMFSSLGERAPGATLEALALGASDYVAKPVGPQALAAIVRRVEEVLVPKLRYFGAVAHGMEPAPSASHG